MFDFPQSFSRDTLLAAARRELSFRSRVYARRVDAGKMSSAQASKEIAAMRQIGDMLENMLDAEFATIMRRVGE